jgi:hypothetical protein
MQIDPRQTDRVVDLSFYLGFTLQRFQFQLKRPGSVGITEMLQHADVAVDGKRYLVPGCFQFKGHIHNRQRGGEADLQPDVSLYGEFAAGKLQHRFGHLRLKFIVIVCRREDDDRRQ